MGGDRVGLGEDRQVAPAAKWWRADAVTQRWHGVFKGGGAKGVAYVGALRAVNDRGCWFDAVAGSSAGAITAMLIAAGLTVDEIEAETPELLGRIKLNPQGLALAGSGPLYRLGGVTQRLREIVTAQIERYAPGTSGEPTFATLQAATGIELYVVGTDLATGQPMVFHHLTTPECDVAIAVAASCAIPVAFGAGRLVMLHKAIGLNQPLSVHRIVDGGAWANYPVFVFKDESFRTYQALPELPQDAKVVGFALERPGELVLTVPWTFRPDLEHDEESDLGLYVRSRLARSILAFVDKTKWRLMVFVVWPVLMTIITVRFLLADRGANVEWLESKVPSGVPIGRAVILASFALSAATLACFALGALVVGRQVIRNGIGTVIAAMSVSTNVPPWVGAHERDFLVRVPVPAWLKTRSFKLSAAKRREVVDAACAACHDQVAGIVAERRVPQTCEIGNGIPLRSTDLPKPDDIDVRTQHATLASRFALGVLLLLSTFFLAAPAIGVVVDQVWGGLGSGVLWGVVFAALYAVVVTWLIRNYRRSRPAREAVRDREQTRALACPPGAPITVEADKLITSRKLRGRMRNRIFGAVLFAGVTVAFAVNALTGHDDDTGLATIVTRTDVAEHTHVYEVRIEEGVDAGTIWEFDSNRAAAVGATVRLRFVGGEQRLEFAGDRPSGVGLGIAFFGYVAAMNLIGIRWVVTDRRWLQAHPEMRAPQDQR